VVISPAPASTSATTRRQRETRSGDFRAYRGVQRAAHPTRP
jgi:hypothetical protein